MFYNLHCIIFIISSFRAEQRVSSNLIGCFDSSASICLLEAELSIFDMLALQNTTVCLEKLECFKRSLPFPVAGSKWVSKVISPLAQKPEASQNFVGLVKNQV